LKSQIISNSCIITATPGFQWGSCYSIFSFMCNVCKSLFVLLSLFFWPLFCLSFNLRILITHLVSSNSLFIFWNKKKKKITSQHNILIELILTYELSIGKLSLNTLREGLSFLFNNGLRCVNMISTKLYILIIYNPYTIAMLLFSNYRNNSYDNNWIRRWIYFEY
jgi:hypothetical protein